MDQLELNSNSVNVKIKAHILTDEKMKEIGFTNYHEPNWYFCRAIQFPKEKGYKGFNISFSVTIPKDGSGIRIDVLDEDFCQPYDYQKILESDSAFKPCLIVKEQVEKWMEYLQSNKVLSGHVFGEYI